MSALTGPAHHVRVGHTQFLTRPVLAPSAQCCGANGPCLWHAEGAAVRGVAVDHATAAGHAVLVVEGRTLTTIEVTS
jgi:hypothetical protein